MAEESWKAEYIAIKKIDCFLGVWLSDGNVKTIDKAKISKCNGSAVDTSPIHVNYPVIPEETVVSLEPVEEYPGHDAFPDRYSSLAHPHSEVKSCETTTTTTTTTTLFTVWKLGANINPCDGHNMGYGGPWGTASDVGSASAAFTKDFKDSKVWQMTGVGYVAIARHIGGKCEMAKTWELSDKTRSMLSYFSSYPGRIYATGDGSVKDQHIHADIPENVPNKDTDPIFGAGGGLVFNWYYSNNGARIALPAGYKSAYSLPGAGENNDDLHGLGNEFGANTAGGHGSSHWWHDVAQLSGDCHGGSCKVVGTDKGSHLHASDCWNNVNYAIYVSENATKFLCQGKTLQADFVA
jgi:hypothetical protein